MTPKKPQLLTRAKSLGTRLHVGSIIDDINPNPSVLYRRSGNFALKIFRRPTVPQCSTYACILFSSV